jgi:magnesium chelatase family protein
LRATFRNCGIDLPARKFVLNLAPSDSKKIGTSFDVPMALGVLILLSEQNFHHKNLLEEALFFGEL